MTTYKFMIDGKAIDSGTSFEVKNPATGKVIGSVAVATPDDVMHAVQSAKAAQRDWAAKSDEERKLI